MSKEDTVVLGENYKEKLRKEWDEENPDPQREDSAVRGPDGEMKEQPERKPSLG